VISSVQKAVLREQYFDIVRNKSGEKVVQIQSLWDQFNQYNNTTYHSICLPEIIQTICTIAFTILLNLLQICLGAHVRIL
jgi:hypothetical protein